MNTTNLKELRELRNQEKAIKARIDEISTEATNEAVAILAEKGLEKESLRWKALVDSNCNGRRVSTLATTAAIRKNRR